MPGCVFEGSEQGGQVGYITGLCLTLLEDWAHANKFFFFQIRAVDPDPHSFPLLDTDGKNLKLTAEKMQRK